LCTQNSRFAWCLALLQYDARFDLPPEEVPYGSIALAVFLMAFGLTALVLAWMHFTQVIFGKEQAVSCMPQCSCMTQPAVAAHTVCSCNNMKPLVPHA
jgi:hypothetical protein